METFLLQNTGVQLETRPDLGRVVVATRDFKVLYNKVIREAPALTWPKRHNGHHEWHQFFSAFLTLPQDVQDGILDMYHPPLSPKYDLGHQPNHLIASLKRDAQALGRVFPYSVDFIHKLMAIVATNAHDYRGHMSSAGNDGDIRQYEMLGGNNGATHAALFLFGSKIQHSCYPNVTYSSQTADGALEYKVIRPIDKGQEISFAYIGDLFETPTYERRIKLQSSKSFFCMCERCMGPDYCRVARCPQCKEFQSSAPPPLPPSYSKKSNKDTISKEWICKSCGVQKHVGQQEMQLLFEFESSRVQTAEAPTAPLYSIRNKVITELSPTHFLVIRLWKELAKLYASKAAFLDQIESMTGRGRGGSRSYLPPHLRQMRDAMAEGLSNDRLRQKAAIAGLRAIALTECVASGTCLLGCPPGSFCHELDYGSASPMFHVCIDLKEIPASMRPPYAEEMVRRYLSILYGQFGENDPDVASIEKALLKKNNPKKSTLRLCDYPHCSKSKTEQQLKTCARCKLVSYCSKDCQVLDWKLSHKAQCLPCVR